MSDIKDTDQSDDTSTDALGADELDKVAGGRANTDVSRHIEGAHAQGLKQ